MSELLFIVPVGTKVHGFIHPDYLVRYDSVASLNLFVDSTKGVCAAMVILDKNVESFTVRPEFRLMVLEQIKDFDVLYAKYSDSEYLRALVFSSKFFKTTLEGVARFRFNENSVDAFQHMELRCISTASLKRGVYQDDKTYEVVGERVKEHVFDLVEEVEKVVSAEAAIEAEIAAKVAAELALAEKLRREAEEIALAEAAAKAKSVADALELEKAQQKARMVATEEAAALAKMEALRFTVPIHEERCLVDAADILEYFQWSTIRSALVIGKLEQVPRGLLHGIQKVVALDILDKTFNLRLDLERNGFSAVLVIPQDFYTDEIYDRLAEAIVLGSQRRLYVEHGKDEVVRALERLQLSVGAPPLSGKGFRVWF